MLSSSAAIIPCYPSPPRRGGRQSDTKNITQLVTTCWAERYHVVSHTRTYIYTDENIISFLFSKMKRNTFLKELIKIKFEMEDLFYLK
jgi:hypothetical protein